MSNSYNLFIIFILAISSVLLADNTVTKETSKALPNTTIIKENKVVPIKVTNQMVSSVRKKITAKSSSKEEKLLALEQLKKYADTKFTEAVYWYAWMRFYGYGNKKADKKEALSYFEKAAKKNHYLALYWVGYYYGNGYVVKKDPIKAKEYMKKSADTGVLAQMLHFAKQCQYGSYFKRDYPLALEYLNKTLTKNYAPGIAYLAKTYAKGWGVKKDYKKAFNLYKKAADLGDVAAMYEVGMASCFSRGVTRDPKLEMEYFSKAAAKGHVEATYRVGNTYYFGFAGEQSFTKALEYFHKAAKKGSLDAINQIGFCYLRGFGVKKDSKEALKWFEKGVKRKSVSSYMNLARMYLFGEGVEKDYQKAFNYYNLIHQSKDSFYKRITGGEISIFYEQGIIVKKDLAKAFYYNNLSYGTAGRIKAGIALLKGAGTKVNVEAALLKFEAAYKFNKSPEAALLAASIYIANKPGYPYNPDRAMELLEFAAEHKNRRAIQILIEGFRFGKWNFPKDEAIAMQWQKKLEALKLGE